MANRFFGEVAVQALGETYTLRCDFNAMCEFEDATGKDAMTSFAAYEGGNASVKDMRAMMHAFLLHHHPDATVELAGDILSEDTGTLMAVLKATMPADAEVKEMGNGRKAKAKPKAA